MLKRRNSVRMVLALLVVAVTFTYAQSFLVDLKKVVSKSVNS